VLDVALTRTFAIAGWLDLDVSISVKNLFDKDYEVKPGISYAAAGAVCDPCGCFLI
jgi:outer membrane cobalamin receptor